MLRYFFITLIAAMLAACATAPRTEKGRTELRQEADQALQEIRAQSPTVDQILWDSHGFVVFPTVGKGGAIVGGAYGKGVVYERGNVVGYADVTEGTAGLQLGGQKYTQLVVFENAHAMNRFKQGELAFDARASAVAIEAGAGAGTAFRDGVAVFIVDEKGLMFEAAVGGQRFTYIPL